MESLLILGRQPALGKAELESIYGSSALQPIGSQAVIARVSPSNIDIRNLGGTMKLCEFIGYIPSAEWPQLINYLSATLPGRLKDITTGKIVIGLSLYGFGLSASKINAGALSLKKNLKSADRGIRIVPNKQPELNTAQVIHNQLTRQNGIELVLVRVGKRTALGQTVAVQDIDAYAARDQARPARDARVGMLPPKLAQIIVNLAQGTAAHNNPTPEDSSQPPVVLDPFCGTGVVLQEALLMGYRAYGSDLEPRMINFSGRNLDWLAHNHHLNPATYKLEPGDATSHTWHQPVDTIACETYLGRPFSATPDTAVLKEVIRDVDTIHKKFLQNVAAQTKPGFRLCIAVPAWKSKNNFTHLPILDHLTDLGYNRVSFVHAADNDLIYHRPEQVVARELVVLERS